MILKIHGTGRKKILAICDSEILGRRFEEGKLQLDLASPFYKGEKASRESIEKEIFGSYIVNAAGERCIGLLLELKLAEEKDIKRIGGIPYTMIVLV
jgi:uncharacterized protein